VRRMDAPRGSAATGLLCRPTENARALLGCPRLESQSSAMGTPHPPGEWHRPAGPGARPWGMAIGTTIRDRPVTRKLLVGARERAHLVVGAPGQERGGRRATQCSTFHGRSRPRWPPPARRPERRVILTTHARFVEKPAGEMAGSGDYDQMRPREALRALPWMRGGPFGRTSFRRWDGEGRRVERRVAWTSRSEFSTPACERRTCPPSLLAVS
jgi:hypothetical protein